MISLSEKLASRSAGATIPPPSKISTTPVSGRRGLHEPSSSIIMGPRGQSSSALLRPRWERVGPTRGTWSHRSPPIMTRQIPGVSRRLCASSSTEAVDGSIPRRLRAASLPLRHGMAHSSLAGSKPSALQAKDPDRKSCSPPSCEAISVTAGTRRFTSSSGDTCGSSPLTHVHDPVLDYWEILRR